MYSLSACLLEWERWIEPVALEANEVNEAMKICLAESKWMNDDLDHARFLAILRHALKICSNKQWWRGCRSAQLFQIWIKASSIFYHSEASGTGLTIISWSGSSVEVIFPSCVGGTLKFNQRHRSWPLIAASCIHCFWSSKQRDEPFPPSAHAKYFRNQVQSIEVAIPIYAAPQPFVCCSSFPNFTFY